jgi:hypothetical protein
MQNQRPRTRTLELIGFLLILAGMAVFPLTGETSGAGALLLIGFILFIVGRFQN